LDGSEVHSCVPATLAQGHAAIVCKFEFLLYTAGFLLGSWKIMLKAIQVVLDWIVEIADEAAN
jgi:hypothetical protein